MTPIAIRLSRSGWRPRRCSVDRRGIGDPRTPLRRDVIGFYLGRSDRTTDLDDLADRIVSAREVPGGPVDRDRIAAALHHRHLPLLSEQGVIEIDPKRGYVRYHPDELVERWFEQIRSEASA